jgi:hypothetical protein
MATDREQYYIGEWQKQKDYHSKKAGQFKTRYQISQILIVVGSVSVPVLLGISEIPTIVPTLISLMVAILTGLEGISKNGENWVTYRRTSEQLKREQRAYLTRTAEYKDTESPFDVFVTRVEAILSQQNQSFGTINRPPETMQGSPSSRTIPPGN